ncbi:MAG TPA: hypothetical protein PKI81_02415 [bacterium]|nr:hypothetical protein [bacterium]
MAGIGAAPNARTRIRCRLGQEGRIRLVLVGREKVLLADEWRSAGEHEWEVAGEGLATGLYFCVLLDSRGGMKVEKLALIR